MSAISEKTRTLIKAYLEGYVNGVIDANKRRKGINFESPSTYLEQKFPRPVLTPFLAAIIPEGFWALNSFGRRFRRILWKTFEECARLIALDHYPEVHRAHVVSGYTSRRATREIELQVLRFHQTIDAGETPPSLDEMITAVLDKRDDGETALKRIQTDLHIRTLDGIEYFFEITPPIPNEDACYSLTNRMLHNYLLRGLPRPQAQSYVAFAYNPYGNTRGDYRWSVARMYLPFEQATLIGDEFWRIIGGETAYTELLEIYAEVGHDKSKHMIESLVYRS